MLNQATHCPAQNRFALLLEMLNQATHCPAQNRFALLLEMLIRATHCPAQNRFALLLEMLNEKAALMDSAAFRFRQISSAPERAWN
ncbi:hypothetical protein [Brucella intermedia]|uniref:hypothetical protein n=1 Tax=Brucella intermedia TaxID=94625 RepID=UPI003F5CE609